MRKIREILTFYFHFSKRESNGVLVLLSLMMLFLAYSLLGNRLIKGKKIDYPKVDSLMMLYETHDNKTNQIDSLNINTSFDPNTLDQEDWEAMGIRTTLAKRISYYVSKGGRFYRKTDLLRMCGMMPAIYEQLEPFIDIPKTAYKYKKKGFKKYKKKAYKKYKKKKYEKKKYKKYIKKEIIPFELNSADTAQLRQIPGIGPVLSERILKYRKYLGGFTDWSQVDEVYGIDPEVIVVLRQHASLEPSHIKKLNINTATFYQLKKHPYIKYKLAKVITNYRTSHGEYKTVEDLLKIKIIDDAKLKRMRPYLTVK